jgi:hypothetical protein
MSDTVATEPVKTEEVKPIVVPEPVSAVSDALKGDVEKIVKDVLKAAIKELLEDLKKPAVLSKLDKDGDGVISAAEVKEQVQKLGCAPSCTIS